MNKQYYMIIENLKLPLLLQHTYTILFPIYTIRSKFRVWSCEYFSIYFLKGRHFFQNVSCNKI